MATPANKLQARLAAYLGTAPASPPAAKPDRTAIVEVEPSDYRSMLARIQTLGASLAQREEERESLTRRIQVMRAELDDRTARLAAQAEECERLRTMLARTEAPAFRPGKLTSKHRPARLNTPVAAPSAPVSDSLCKLNADGTYSVTLGGTFVRDPDNGSANTDAQNERLRALPDVKYLKAWGEQFKAERRRNGLPTIPAWRDYDPAHPWR